MVSETKVCRECGIEKDRSEFRTFTQKQKWTRKDGTAMSSTTKCWKSYCFQCERIVQNRYYKKNSKHYANKCRERYYRDETSRLGKVMQTTIRSALNGNKRGRKWQQLVGYSIDELKLHLESRFLDGMSWNNYGDWHVDHIVPKSWFYYETPDDWQFKVCWSRCNLQPSWARDNLSKNNHYAGV